MSPSAVPHADRQRRQNGMEVVATATGHHDRCFLRHAPSAAKTPKCLLRLPVAGRSIAAIATEKSDRVDNAGVITYIYGPGIPGLYMSPEYGDASSQRDTRRVEVIPELPCYVIFKR
jgi:hypothetical protein